MLKIGEFTVKGLAYEDVVAILWNNGYATEVFTPSQPNTNINNILHIIRVYQTNESEED